MHSAWFFFYIWLGEGKSYYTLQADKDFIHQDIGANVTVNISVCMFSGWPFDTGWASGMVLRGGDIPPTLSILACLWFSVWSWDLLSYPLSTLTCLLASLFTHNNNNNNERKRDHKFERAREKEGRDNVVIIRIRWKPEEVCSLMEQIDGLL